MRRSLLLSPEIMAGWLPSQTLGASSIVYAEAVGMTSPHLGKTARNPMVCKEQVAVLAAVSLLGEAIFTVCETPASSGVFIFSLLQK